MIVLLILIVIGIAFWFSVSYSVAREATLKRNNFICFEERGGTSLAMVKNGKVGKVIEADNGKKIKLTEKLYKIRKGWDEIYLYKYEEPKKKKPIKMFIEEKEKAQEIQKQLGIKTGLSGHEKQD